MKLILTFFITLIAFNLSIAENSVTLELDVTKKIPDEPETAHSQPSSTAALADNAPKESNLQDKINDDDLERQKKSYTNLQSGKPVYGDPVPLKVNPNEHIPMKPSNYGESLPTQQNAGYGEIKPLKLDLNEPSISQVGYGEQLPPLQSHGDHQLVPESYKPPIPTTNYKPVPVQKNPQLYQPQPVTHSLSDYGGQPLHLYDTPQLLYDLPQPQLYLPIKPAYAPVKSQYGSAKPNYGSGKPEYFQTVPQYAPAKPQYTPAKPQYQPAKQQYAAVKPEYNPHHSGYASLAPEYAPIKSTYGSSKPPYSSHSQGYTSTRPTYGFSKPIHYGDSYFGYNQPQTTYYGSYGSTQLDYGSLQSAYSESEPIAYASHNAPVYSYPDVSPSESESVTIGCILNVQMKQCQPGGYGSYGSGYSVGGYGYGGSY